MNFSNWPQTLTAKIQSKISQDQLIKSINDSKLTKLKELLNQNKLNEQTLHSLENINIKKIEKFQSLSKQQNQLQQKYDSFKPLTDNQVIDISQINNKDQLQSEALKLISKGECSLILLAGGDGRRLGFEHPKMLFPVNLQDSKTLIEMFIKRIKSLCNLALEKFPNKNLQRNPIIIYLIIQSAHENKIKKYFEDNNYFDYNSIVFVKTEQEINLIDKEGNIIFGQDQKVLKSSMGNGDLITALNSSILKHMDNNNINYVQISGIDNILFRPLDPIFLGVLIQQKFELIFKTIEKKDPKENVGIHGINNKGFNVYEYIHLDDQKRQMKNKDNSLYFKYAHLLNLIATKNALKKMSQQENNFQLFNFVERPFDIYDMKTNQIIKNKKCLKVEWFFMDYYQFIKNQGYLKVDREIEFQPIKSKEGNNTPEQAIKKRQNKIFA